MPRRTVVQHIGSTEVHAYDLGQSDPSRPAWWAVVALDEEGDDASIGLVAEGEEVIILRAIETDAAAPSHEREGPLDLAALAPDMAARLRRWVGGGWG